MTARDHLFPPPGYYPSVWPGECGGPRRQKVTRAPGLRLQPGEALAARTRRLDDDRWPVMFVLRDPGELYLQGGSRAGQNRTSYGWVEQLHPETLEPVKRSPDLPSGGHNWCGAACVHANGDIYVVNGAYAHRLTPDLEVVAERRLSVDNAHNGHLVLSDGALVAKDIQNDPARRSVFTVLSPDLEIIDRYEFPWNSVGRFSADAQDGEDHLYVTSGAEIRRLIYRDGRLSLDPDWSAGYRIAGEDQAFAWDSTLGDDCAWFMDMGENAVVRAVLAAHPIGTQAVEVLPPAALEAPDSLRPALRQTTMQRYPNGAPIHAAPQRLFRVSLRDAADRDAFVLFDQPQGNIIAPPLYDQDRRILVAFDTANRRLGAWRYHGPGDLRPLWQHPWRTTNQLTLYADTGELFVDDCTTPGRWDAVVVDVETGVERGRADTGCILSGGMWYTPGFGRDAYTSSPLGAIARLHVADG